MDYHTSENPVLEPSRRQQAISRLGVYLCHLETMRNEAQTTPEEIEKIELIYQNKEDGFPDPESLIEKICPKGLWLVS